ncbi:emp24/gp25L/p24 family/GOLD, putative [Trypanosoma equiperdum]|uniref:GOLD domain-containing protein n=2 Tax=Trypanozoon TaxID=39700 RepID=Q57WH5_TRYB2|nr:hypothetical protein, conserved [Trypanosoma brucei brucei TREU927]AAX70046.1 hypothetical protein, conserved [Trypanosoma brucei]AAZ12424.1 hypothetical protein, conserved [Trypanosoma brucei brucei TREU927]SCU67155.1 emp24/gp25L/p24 family/GOLD, putative [Trypanosoma equiperdum]
MYRSGTTNSHRDSLQISSLVMVCFYFATYTGGVDAVRVRPTEQQLSIDINNEEVCMYSHGVHRREGVMFHYHSLRGGNDFDFYIRDPDNRTVYVSYAGEHADEERVYFTKRVLGEYSYCVDNRPYTGSIKTVKMSVGMTSLKRWKDRIDPLMRMMDGSDRFMLAMHDDQMIFRLREEHLRKKVQESKKLVLFRGVAETAVILFVCTLQVLLIKRMFNRKGTRAVA